MGLNEWGIDVNANTWAQALRAHLKGKQTFVTSDGFPVLFAAVTLGSRQPQPMWVVDGVYLNEAPVNVRSLAYLIREVNVYKYDTAKFGSRGAAGVIEIFTLSGFSESTGSYKRSFEVKGKENIMFSRYGSRINSSNNKPTKINTYLTHIFYASWYENNIMEGVTVLDFSREDFQQILKAKNGRFDKKSSSWIFSDGSIVSIDPSGQTTNIQFKEYTYPFVEGPMELAKVPKDANEMTLKQAIQAEKIYEKTGNLKEVRRIKVRIQEKFTLPFACLVFGLIGSSLGSKSNLRSSKSQGFGLSVILILIYYVMSFLFSSFGVKGILPPIFAAWLPVLISLGGGIYLLRKSSSF